MKPTPASLHLAELLREALPRFEPVTVYQKRNETRVTMLATHYAFRPSHVQAALDHEKAGEIAVNIPVRDMLAKMGATGWNSRADHEDYAKWAGARVQGEKTVCAAEGCERMVPVSSGQSLCLKCRMDAERQARRAALSAAAAADAGVAGAHVCTEDEGDDVIGLAQPPKGQLFLF